MYPELVPAWVPWAQVICHLEGFLLKGYGLKFKEFLGFMRLVFERIV